MRISLRASSIFFILVGSKITVAAFEIPNPFKGVKLGNNSGTKGGTSIATTKSKLIEAVSNTNNGKDATVETQRRVLDLVRTLEMESPVSETILSNPEEAKILDGVWYLQYTSPSDLGDDSSDDVTEKWVPENLSGSELKITTKPVNNKGQVTAVTVQVDTANKETKQIFDITKGTVSNTVEQDFGNVSVGGSFRQSDSVPNRAVVAFEDCQITLNNGFVLNLGFVFSILAVFRGTKDAGWLETTYIDDDLRIGRGNKSSMFVLTRDRDTVTP